MMPQGSPTESSDINSGADGVPNRVHLLGNFSQLDHFLGEHCAGTSLAISGVLPLVLYFFGGTTGWFRVAVSEFQHQLAVVFGRLRNKTSSKMASTSSSALAGTGTEIPSELRMVLCFLRRTRSMMRSTPVSSP